MKNLIKSGWMILVAVSLLTASCDQILNSENGGKGTVVISLTDAPFPVGLVDQALVTIDKIELRSVAPETAPEAEKDNAALYTVLYEGEGKEFDLLDLQNGVTAELLSYELEAGSYDMVRMHVASAEVVLKDNKGTFDLKVPSGSSSGLKIKISPVLVVEEGVESEVILDFDVSKSFVVQGNSKTPAGIKGFLFKPTLRAMCQKYSGIIAGKVSENETTPVSEAHVQIYASGADTVYTSAITNKSGMYKMTGLPAGTYKLVCEKEGYKAVTIEQVMVKARETTNQNVTLIK